jgi:uncharacterized protein
VSHTGVTVDLLDLLEPLSTLWLRSFTQGPLEWLWRWGNWGHRRPLRHHTESVN